uniref:ECRG4 augurin n=1 Tax=Oncorhynchus kisutch TaxID=8019 RepID=A0A8C7IEX1_ONCKI
IDKSTSALSCSDRPSWHATHAVLCGMSRVGGTKPAGVAVAPSKAKEFLTSLRRPKRNIWDRSRPDVQQWIMQFMHMGYDEARLETDLSYWMDLARHGANVNYDYY